MEVFRLVKEKYAEPLSGIGASLAGGRWNSKGIEVIYTSSSRALAVLEVLVHLPLNLVPEDLIMLIIFIPDDIKIEQIEIQDLPENWQQFPPLKATQLIGDAFIAIQNSLVLRTHSAVVQGDFNYLINPKHPDFSRIKIVEKTNFLLDKRLL